MGLIFWALLQKPVSIEAGKWADLVLIDGDLSSDPRLN